MLQTQGVLVLLPLLCNKLVPAQFRRGTKSPADIYMPTPLKVFSTTRVHIAAQVYVPAVLLARLGVN